MVKNNRGWTLVELMMVLAILGVLVMVAPNVLTQTTKVFVMGRTKIQLQQEARAAIYVITRELRQAQSSSLIIDTPLNQPYYSRLRFNKVQGASVTITQQGTSLILTEGTNRTVLSQNLEYLAFTFPQSDDMTIISVSLTLQKLIYNGAYKALHMASERVRVMD